MYWMDIQRPSLLLSEYELRESLGFAEGLMRCRFGACTRIVGFDPSKPRSLKTLSSGGAWPTA
jgi:hypothetical protein